MGPLKRLPASLIREYVQATPADLVVESKAANYTVVAGDIGKVLNCTGTFTLTLDPAATLGSGFFFYVKNSGTGYITVDPDSAELIDGRTETVLYPNEGWAIICTGTGFITEGKAREVLISSQTLSVATAEVEILAGFSDSELQDFRLDFKATGATGGATLRLGCRVGAVYGSNQSQAAVVTSSGSGVSEYNQINQTSLRLNASNILATGIVQIANGTAGPVPVAMSIMDGNLITTFGNGYVTGGALDGVKFFYSAGNISSGSYFAVRGTR